jgi:hypothetical protein
VPCAVVDPSDQRHSQTILDNAAQVMPRKAKALARLLFFALGSANWAATHWSEARAETLDIFRVSEHTQLTNVPLVIAPVLFPFIHLIEPGAKLFTSNALHNLFTAITRNFDCFNC